MLLWRGCLFGPCDSEWEGAVLPLQLTFPPDYPLKPPHIRFTCRMYHPNVFADGGLCLDIISDKWSVQRAPHSRHIQRSHPTRSGR